MPSKKSQRKQKKSKTLRRRYKKGGCGSCNSSPPSPFITGGSSSSLDQAINHNPTVIPYNQSHGSVIDPNDPSNMVSVRMQPNIISGGKKKSKKTKTKRRKLRGGNADPSAANAISSFGNTTGLSSAYSILTGSPGDNSSITNQPIGDSYFGPHNPALI